jgi:hypothetical protein
MSIGGAVDANKERLALPAAAVRRTVHDGPLFDYAVGTVAAQNFLRALSQSTPSGNVVLATAQAADACFLKGLPMRRAVNAALLSAFVFPGVGHLYLRRRARALVFLLPSALAVIWFVGYIARQASAMADQLLAGTLTPDPTAIAARLQAQGGGSAIGTVCGLVFLACWVGSTVDSFVLARGAAQPQQ